MYQPKIREDQIRKLYLLKEKIGKPMTMTKLVQQAVDEFLDKHEKREQDELEKHC